MLRLHTIEEAPVQLESCLALLRRLIPLQRGRTDGTHPLCERFTYVGFNHTVSAHAEVGPLTCIPLQVTCGIRRSTCDGQLR